MKDNTERNAMFIALFRDGWSYCEIAASMGCTPNVVAGALHRAGERRGLVRRKTGPSKGRAKPTLKDVRNVLRDKRDMEDLLILRRWDDGWSAGEIAHAMNLSRNVVIGRIDRIAKAAEPGDISRPWGEENTRLHPASF